MPQPTGAWRQHASAPSAGSYCHRASDESFAAQRSTDDLHGTGARAGARRVIYCKSAAVDHGAAGLSVGIRQNQRASSNFSERTAETFVIDPARKSRAQVIAAHNELIVFQCHKAIPFDGTHCYLPYIAISQR